MEIMKLTIKGDFRRGTFFSCFSYHKITLFENKYAINVSVNSKPDHSPRAAPGDSHILVARGFAHSML